MGDMLGLMAVMAAIGVPLAGYLLLEMIAREQPKQFETTKRKATRR